MEDKSLIKPVEKTSEINKDRSFNDLSISRQDTDDSSNEFGGLFHQARENDLNKNKKEEKEETKDFKTTALELFEREEKKSNLLSERQKLLDIKKELDMNDETLNK